MEFHPAAKEHKPSDLKCSYISVPQISERYGYFLSRPSWLWGGEMGANEHGVTIGNEAVFTNTRSLKPALLGMDLLRLGLERAKDATAALETITQLLDTHGQGGPAGFRKKNVHYDSSFLIVDAESCWKLETAGKHWAAKHYQRPQGKHLSVNISNRLSIGSDYDRHSEGLLTYAKQSKRWNGKTPFNFARCFDSKLIPGFAAARSREQQGQKALQKLCEHPASLPHHWSDFAQLLRRHKQGSQADPANGSNHDTCMHAGGPIRQSQTTASLIVKIQKNDTRLAATGTSAPCLSIFRPLSFDNHSWSALQSQENPHSLWHEQEHIHRLALFNNNLRASIRGDIQLTESVIFDALNAPKASLATQLGKADLSAMEWQQRQLARAEGQNINSTFGAYGYYWQRLNNKDGFQ